jgi:hypothetical protein
MAVAKIALLLFQIILSRNQFSWISLRIYSLCSTLLKKYWTESITDSSEKHAVQLQRPPFTEAPHTVQSSHPCAAMLGLRKTQTKHRIFYTLWTVYHDTYTREKNQQVAHFFSLILFKLNYPLRVPNK